MGILATIKAYADLIIGAVALVVLVALGLYIHTLKAERDKALATVQSQALTIQGYAYASKMAQDTITAHAQAATEQGKQIAKVVLDLQATVPKTDEEARQWAIKASKEIQ